VVEAGAAEAVGAQVAEAAAQVAKAPAQVAEAAAPGVEVGATMLPGRVRFSTAPTAEAPDGRTARKSEALG
jgi:hypothetical protein